MVGGWAGGGGGWMDAVLTIRFYPTFMNYASKNSIYIWGIIIDFTKVIFLQ